MNEKVVSIVEQLSKEYNFNIEEALQKLELNTSSSPTRKIVLPWTGEVCNKSCCGIKLYHRMFIQCSNSPSKNGLYCKTCEKNKLKYGTIEDRKRVKPLDYVSPGGIKVLPYINIMEKLNLTKEEVIREANRLDITIPDDQFVKVKKTRGRPKKQILNVSDTESEKSVNDDEQKKVKKRGRPKKEKKEVKVDIGKAAAASMFNFEKIKTEHQNNELIEITVTKKRIKNKDYLISISNNKLFDIETHEEVGYWNEATEQIEELES